MKISFDPMPALRQGRKDKVNANFNTIGAMNAHLDQAYKQKRDWAMVNSDKLSPEAELRGITVAALSQLILSKPDVTATREMQRQQIMKRIDDAQSPAELDAI